MDEAEIVAIIGPNGAGKSTLVKTIIGILKPSRGSIRFRGGEITGRDPEDLVPEGLAYVPQNRNIFPSLTVLENLEVGAITRRPGWLHIGGEALKELWRTVVRGRGRPGKGVGDHPLRNRMARGNDGGTNLAGRRFEGDAFRKRVEYITTIFPNLKARMTQRAGTLSGGEQQMVAFGKALVLDPILLLIDEPSAGLAPKLQWLIFQKIQEISEHGTAILLIEQNAKRALAMADRGYVLEMGRNRYEGTGEALLTDPEVGRLYLGG